MITEKCKEMPKPPIESLELFTINNGRMLAEDFYRKRGFPAGALVGMPGSAGEDGGLVIGRNAYTFTAESAREAAEFFVRIADELDKVEIKK